MDNSNDIASIPGCAYEYTFEYHTCRSRSCLSAPIPSHAPEGPKAAEALLAVPVSRASGWFKMLLPVELGSSKSSVIREHPKSKGKAMRFINLLRQARTSKYLVRFELLAGNC